jgi:hypothetical protein
VLLGEDTDTVDLYATRVTLAVKMCLLWCCVLSLVFMLKSVNWQIHLRLDHVAIPQGASRIGT